METKIEKGMLRSFGHLETMLEERLTEQIYGSGVNGRAGRVVRRSYHDQLKRRLGQIRMADWISF